MNKKIYQFEGFVLDQNKRQLFFGLKPLDLSPKAFDILFLLLTNNGNIVGKEQIFETVWADSFVEESNLPVYISALRKIFKENGNAADFIKTVSGRGYVFIAPVAEISPTTTNSAEKGFENNLTAQTEAEKFYVRGQYIVETISTRIKIESDLYRAIEFFNSAVKLDSNFVEAYVGIGFAHYHLNNFGYISKKEALAKCKIVLEQAKSINRQLSEVFCLEGMVNILFELDIVKAQAALHKAVALNPNNARAYHWLGNSVMVFGKMNEASQYLNKALSLKPTSVSYLNAIVRIHYFAWEFNTAVMKAKEVLEMDSRSVAAYYFLAAGYAELGIYDEALRYCDEILRIFDTNLELWFKRAYILLLMGQPVEAEKLLAEVLSNETKIGNNLSSIVSIYAVQNKLDEAFDLLFEYYDKTDSDILTFKINPCYKNLRTDARFQIMLEKLKLV